jgi:hypothetical protein
MDVERSTPSGLSAEELWQRIQSFTPATGNVVRAALPGDLEWGKDPEIVKYMGMVTPYGKEQLEKTSFDWMQVFNFTP